METKERMNVAEFLGRYPEQDQERVRILAEVRVNPSSFLKKLIADAEHADLRRMIKFFRDTQYHWVFLFFLCELDREVWPEHHLQAEYLAEDLEPDEKRRLRTRYWTSEFQNNPLVEFLCLAFA